MKFGLELSVMLLDLFKAVGVGIVKHVEDVFFEFGNWGKPPGAISPTDVVQGEG